MVSSTANGVGNHDALDFTIFHNVINGKLVGTSKTRHGINPATEKPNPEVPVATPSDVDDAVTAARLALEGWAKTDVEDRQKAVRAFADALLERKDSFSKMLVQEVGKVRPAAIGEVFVSSKWMKDLSTIDLKDEIIEDNEDRHVVLHYKPLGVVVAIVPWNYPIHLACGKIAPALVTGNTIIVKPSPFAPYSVLKLVELAQKFFPPGVIQALSGDDNLGPWLTEHPGVDKITFTGSTATGKRVMQSASKSLKRITLELGGNDPAIVCADVDVAKAASAVCSFAFKNSGQACIAIKRVYVHESIYAEFRDIVVKLTQSMKHGEGNEEGVIMGPVQNSTQYEHLKGLFADIEKEKLKIATGGMDLGRTGYFVKPTIVDNPPEGSRVVVEEPFGPVLPLMSWKTEEDVISRANNTKMALGSSVWSSDLVTAKRIGAQLEAGNVWINEHMTFSPFIPFGGLKESGFGSEWGRSGLEQFCNATSMYVPKK